MSTIQFNKIRAIAFDFDGVILDSVSLKADLFIASYPFPLSEQEKSAILAYQAAHGGVGRVKKFEHFERSIFGREPDSKAIAALAKRYSNLLMDQIAFCAELPGARNFLRRFERTLSLHLVSGTSHDDLLKIVGDRDMADFFQTITGSPTGKVEAFTAIARATGYAFEQILAIGDSTTEFAAACEVGMPFVGIVEAGAENPFPAKTPVYNDLATFGAVWPLAD
ncbi:HAD family hydrolase [Paraburkholderia sp. Ac-20340]|uniref:HAD family hydrolase n=1 Tax=Paraburkholderia sp. Ac-20340 TaxID=2703888 RepID=UPI00197EBF72|nr:HAD family hydrolase [Paraburkholderia sp. Ac-20340]MBN3854009.1 HAD family hydrolase [Paraburkholderia sp. Ac-20340]